MNAFIARICLHPANVRAIAISILGFFIALLPLRGLAHDAPFAANELAVKAIFASRPNDSATYVFLASGFFRSMSTVDADRVVAQWLAAHPTAIATPVSSMALGRGIGRIVYVWLDDGPSNLQVQLIREGAYPGGVMVDPTETQAASRRLLHDQSRDPAPLTRLVSVDRYTAFMRRVIEAENEARREKKGIWADEFKMMREQEGLE